MAFDDEFKAAMASWATGVAVLTATEGGLVYGITVNSFTSVSLDPPLVLVCVNLENRIDDMIRRTGRFALSVLRADQEAVSRAYATTGRVPTSAFDDGEWTPRGLPVVKGAVARVECDLHAEHDGGDHVILVGRVAHAEADESAGPLLYWRRGYRAFEGV